MAEYTQNYNLEKQKGNDYVSIEGLNGNFDIIDSEIKKVNDNKVDKEAGKALSANDYTTAEKTKLSGIAENANNYVHPTTHSPAIIAQDSNNRFVTDTEKASWNGKASGTHVHSAADITSGTLPVARGGTAATTAAQALTNLGAASTTAPTFTGAVTVLQTGNTNSFTHPNIELRTTDGTSPTLGFHRAGVSATALIEGNGRLYINNHMDSTLRKIYMDGDIIFQTTIPTSLADGVICFVYE